MAELEVSVQYKSLPNRIGVYAMGVLMPVWAIAIPFCLGLFIALLIKMPADVPPLAAVTLLLLLISVIVFSIVLSAVCEDDQLLVSKEGLSFPLMMLPWLKFRRERMWSDLTDAQLAMSSEAEKDPEKNPNGVISLRFKSGGLVNIGMKQISRSDLEQLLLALEVWGNNCKRSPELISFHNDLQNENLGLDKVSYTQMWEEELSRRFSATAFVPLEPERKLMDGRIRIVRQLAFGGLSAIYLAQKDEHELVVIKEAVVPANADETSRAKAIELFKREAAFLIRLNHPNVARVFDHFQEEGRNYLVLEYIRGQDLRQMIKQHGAQEETPVLDWARQVADILIYLHTQEPPIIHRDLTPDNLVRRDDGSITLIDFGAANEFVGTATGTLVGKQAYIAPEQLRGKATLKSDIYAFGGTLFYLLTATDPDALSESHPRELRSSLSEEIDRLVAKCTSMEEEDRPQSAKELLLAIDELLGSRKAASLGAGGEDRGH